MLARAERRSFFGRTVIPDALTDRRRVRGA
jgi:hypothetical protein